MLYYSEKITQTLLHPYQLSADICLKNRIVMAPVTRCFADEKLTPTAEMAAYYEKRAEAGLIITEATIVRPDGQGYPNVPGIFNKEQIDGWQRVTDKVHAGGGQIFLQLWHVGRLSHPVYLQGNKPVAPSAISAQGSIARRRDVEYETPRALLIEEIPQLVDAFGRAAENAQRAGFDGVEIHGANGYLVDQFLHYFTNHRDDAWGGSVENMTRFALAVLDAVIRAIGKTRVGIRLSPGAYHQMQEDQRDPSVFKHLLTQIEARDIAYVHTGIFDDAMRFPSLGGTVTAFLRRYYAGNLVGCGGYTLNSAARAIAAKRFNLVAFARSFVANPDLIKKIHNNQPLEKFEVSMLKELN